MCGLWFGMGRASVGEFHICKAVWGTDAHVSMLTHKNEKHFKCTKFLLLPLQQAK
jgi:hypothetical protein